MTTQHPIRNTWALCLMFLSFCAFASSNTNETNSVSQAIKMYGKKIEFPTKYLPLGVGERAFSIGAELAKPLKIVTYIDKNSCSECALRILLHWNSLLQELSDVSVGFIPVIYPNDISELVDVLQTMQIDFPLLYDTENVFLKMNKLNRTLAVNRTFLLDSNNKIIVIGEPLASERLWMVYKNALKKDYP